MSAIVYPASYILSHQYVDINENFRPGCQALSKVEETSFIRNAPLHYCTTVVGNRRQEEFLAYQAIMA
jgi:hypothetical protein